MPERLPVVGASGPANQRRSRVTAELGTATYLIAASLNPGCGRRGEDLGGLGPDERVTAFVPAFDEGADRADELLDAVEGLAAVGLPRDDPEERLDQVQPCPRRGTYALSKAG